MEQLQVAQEQLQVLQTGHYNMKLKLDFNCYKIEEGEHPKGYFFHIANSRSGHNFIRKNVQSWTNDPDGKFRKYVNLENSSVEKLHNTLSDDETFTTYSDSIYILNIRNLLSWYSSFFYFHAKYIGRQNKTIEDFKNKIIIYKSELAKNPKLEFNSNIIILDDGRSKEDYIKGKIQVNNSTFHLPHNLDKWLGMAKEYTGETNYLPQFIKIYYDDFFISREYRKGICNKIGGVYDETELNLVPAAGGYSSFDRDNYQGKAQSMKVLERWKNWKTEHSTYLKFFREHEALEFYLNNFEVSDEERRFIDNI